MDKSWYLLASIFLITSFVIYVTINETPDGVLSVSFLDVGQGDAILIEAPNNNQVLIDGGPPNKKAIRELGGLMPFYDRFIDVVIATHPDTDHIGGLVDVIDRFKIGLLIDSGVSRDVLSYEKKEELIKENNIKKIVGRAGMKLVLDQGVVLEILFPDRDALGLSTNDASIITRLTYGDHEFLFTGDASREIEDYISIRRDVGADVFKAGHHGSNTSNGPMILGNMNPNFVVVSAEEDNRYGHPHKEVVNRFEDFNITMLETSKLGTITFLTDGRTLSVK